MDLATLVFPTPGGPARQTILPWTEPLPRLWTWPHLFSPLPEVRPDRLFCPGQNPCPGYGLGSTCFPHSRRSGQTDYFALDRTPAPAMDLAALVFPTPGGPARQTILPWTEPLPRLWTW